MLNYNIWRFVENAEYRADENELTNQFLRFLQDDSAEKIRTELTEHRLCEFSEDNKTFKFTAVGLLQIGESVIICYPKYYNDYALKTREIEKQNSNAKFKQILKVIEKEKDILAKYEPWFAEKNEQNNPFALKIWLIEHFLKNGLYERRETVTSKNENNEILWDKTISQEQAYLSSKKQPFYLNFITRKKQNDSMNLLRRLHKIALNEIVEEWVKSQIIDLFAPNIIIDTNETRGQIGNKNKIMRVLKNGLRAEYNTEKRILINKLISYFEVNNSSDEKRVQIFATTKFNIVWEQVCKTIFNDDNALHDVIKKQKPKWTVEISGKDASNGLKAQVVEVEDEFEETSDKNIEHINKESSGLIPDIVTKHKKDIIILDAKYYVPGWPENQNEPISGVPGVGDVTKQHLYQLAYDSYAVKNDLSNRENAFIMPRQISQTSGSREGANVVPSNNRSINQRASVGLEFLQKVTDEPLSDIQVLELDPEMAIDNYLHKKRGSMIGDLLASTRFCDCLPKTQSDGTRGIVCKIRDYRKSKS